MEESGREFGSFVIFSFAPIFCVLPNVMVKQIAVLVMVTNCKSSCQLCGFLNMSLIGHFLGKTF